MIIAFRFSLICRYRVYYSLRWTRVYKVLSMYKWYKCLYDNKSFLLFLCLSDILSHPWNAVILYHGYNKAHNVGNINGRITRYSIVLSCYTGIGFFKRELRNYSLKTQKPKCCKIKSCAFFWMYLCVILATTRLRNENYESS